MALCFIIAGFSANCCWIFPQRYSHKAESTGKYESYLLRIHFLADRWLGYLLWNGCSHFCFLMPAVCHAWLPSLCGYIVFFSYFGLDYFLFPLPENAQYLRTDDTHVNTYACNISQQYTPTMAYEKRNKNENNSLPIFCICDVTTSVTANT